MDKIAKAYYRPVLTFYLPSPPVPNDEVADFRTVADGGVPKPSPKLRALVSRMKARQQEVLELLEDEDGNLPSPLPFVGGARDSRDVVAVARDIEKELDLPSAKPPRSKKSDDFHRFLRSRVDKIGVYVVTQGDLGNHHSKIDVNEFRGFAFADPVAPFIVINSYDVKPAQTFTLIHELAHIWIGDTGISNYNPFDQGEGADATEKFCNNVAAEFLMPREAISAAWQGFRGMDIEEAVAKVADYFSVSRAAAAHRLWQTEALQAEQWWGLYRIYQDEWQARKDKRKEPAGGANFYVNKNAQLGRRLVGTVMSALDAGQITYTRAARILGVNPSGVSKLRAKGA